MGGGVRYQSSDYLCRQCWQVISGQPWPGEGASPEQQARPPVDRRQAQQQAQQQALLQQQMQQAMQQQQQQQGAGSPLSIDMLQRSLSASMSGLTAQQAVQYTAYQQQLAAQQRQQLGSPFSGLLQQQQQQAAAAGGPPMLGRRSQSFADFQFGGGQGVPIGGGQHNRYTRQPASMPEQPALLGSSDDPRWGNLAAASEPRRSRGIPAAGRSGSHHHLGASAPVQPGLLSSSVAPHFRMGEVRAGSWQCGWVGAAQQAGRSSDTRAPLHPCGPTLLCTGHVCCCRCLPPCSRVLPPQPPPAAGRHAGRGQPGAV